VEFRPVSTLHASCSYSGLAVASGGNGARVILWIPEDTPLKVCSCPMMTPAQWESSPRQTIERFKRVHATNPVTYSHVPASRGSSCPNVPSFARLYGYLKRETKTARFLSALFPIAPHISLTLVTWLLLRFLSESWLRCSDSEVLRGIGRSQGQLQLQLQQHQSPATVSVRPCFSLLATDYSQKGRGKERKESNLQEGMSQKAI
jgi:hypothetical protein